MGQVQEKGTLYSRTKIPNIDGLWNEKRIHVGQVTTNETITAFLYTKVTRFTPQGEIYTIRHPIKHRDGTTGRQDTPYVDFPIGVESTRPNPEERAYPIETIATKVGNVYRVEVPEGFIMKVRA
jgi:hypothetical protein